MLRLVGRVYCEHHAHCRVIHMHVIDKNKNRLSLAHEMATEAIDAGTDGGTPA